MPQRRTIPPDPEFIAALERFGWNRSAYARHSGLGLPAICRHATRLNLPHSPGAPGRGPSERPQIEELRAELERLTARVTTLESRPAARIIEWRPNHRRLVDGGVPVKRQRTEVGL